MCLLGVCERVCVTDSHIFVVCSLCQPLVHTACQHGYADVVALLLRHGANPFTLSSRAESQQRTALHAAADSGCEACVRLLLARGVDRRCATLRG